MIRTFDPVLERARGPLQRKYTQAADERRRRIDEGRCMQCGGPVEDERKMGTICAACVKRRRELKDMREGRDPTRAPRPYCCSNCGGRGHSIMTCGRPHSREADR